jgi:hypothetical protein
MMPVAGTAGWPEKQARQAKLVEKLLQIAQMANTIQGLG